MNPNVMYTRVREEGLLVPGRPVVVLLSGGRDSTCLVDIAARVAGESSVTALHVNYGIRESAAEDHRHCHDLCASLGVTLEVRRPGPPSSGNVQAWAREVRYREAVELAGGADVAAGHTKTDQVETILYRVASSPSRRALLGMRPREGSLVRPLLGFTREDTAAYCIERGLAWREDESNASDAYARNRIRGELVPALRRVHPAAEDNVLAVAQVLRDEAEVLDALVDEVLGDGGAASLAALRALPPALRRLVIQRLADEAAGGFAPGAASRADEIAALGERGTALLDVGNGLRAVAEYGELRFERLDGGHVAPEPVRLAIPGTVTFGGREVRCELTEPALVYGVLDRTALGSSDLLVRSWRPGDRIAPLGLGGTKSLQDLFVERRVPRRERDRVAVVEACGEIAWVAGLAMSDRFKVTPATRQAVRLVVVPGNGDQQGLRSPKHP
ncbi:MAG TPA: tRNA lysidine(34) synthetase TilS [Solirubrobacteraceae bacterium]|nr:tRNA lysidine(34) synthetase TilS [Solirubrobacteraceae bacterium]